MLITLQGSIYFCLDMSLLLFISGMFFPPPPAPPPLLLPLTGIRLRGWHTGCLDSVCGQRSSIGEWKKSQAAVHTPLLSSMLVLDCKLTAHCVIHLLPHAGVCH